MKLFEIEKAIKAGKLMVKETTQGNPYVVIEGKIVLVKMEFLIYSEEFIKRISKPVIKKVATKVVKETVVKKVTASVKKEVVKKIVRPSVNYKVDLEEVARQKGYRNVVSGLIY